MKTQKTKSRLHQISKIIGWLVVPFALVILWQITAGQLNQPWLFPTPVCVLQQLAHPMRSHFNSGSFLGHTGISLIRVTLGFAIASFAGVSLGTLMGSLSTLRYLTEPTIEMLRPLSAIAWLPFAIAVFKLNSLRHLFGLERYQPVLDQIQLGMLFVIFIGGFFPILVNTMDGVSGVRKQYRLLAQSLGAGQRQTFIYVYLPAAMPEILTGLRLGLARCWMVIIAAEMMVGSDSGIGYLLMYAADNSAMDIVIACMVIIGIIGGLMNFLMRYCLHHYTRWKGKEL